MGVYVSIPVWEAWRTRSPMSEMEALTILESMKTSLEPSIETTSTFSDLLQVDFCTQVFFTGKFSGRNHLQSTRKCPISWQHGI
jgi:hypothetical protein